MPTVERSSRFLVPRVARWLAAPAAIFVLDAFVLNQGAIAALVALVAVVIGVPAALYHALVGRGWRSPGLRRAIVFPLAAVAVFVVNRAQNDMARRRADTIIAACDAFHARQARYPATLSELVPEFLPSVPRAKYTLAFSSFEYVSSPSDSPTLFYVALPPFGRPTYSFARHAWGYLD